MKTQKLPPGIRILHNLDGSAVYQARINRQGTVADRRFGTLKEATGWKARIDYLVETGGDLSELHDRKLRRKQSDAQTDAPTQTPHQLAILLSTDTVDADTPLSHFNRNTTRFNPDATVDVVVTDYVATTQKSAKPMRPNQLCDYRRVAHDLKGLTVSSLKNQDVMDYIGDLSKSPRQRDDPRFQRPKNASAATVVPATAKARANQKYKDKLRVERKKNKPEVPPLMAEATVRKIVTALKKSIEWYAKNFGEVNQFLFKFEKGQMPSAWAGQRERRLLPGEEKKLTSAGIDRGDYTYNKSDWAAIIGFALETGMREQEIAKAEFHHVWAEGYKLMIPKKNSKTKKERHALLSKKARVIVAIQQETSPKDNKRIFHQFPSAKAICDAFARLTHRANIDDLHFHDLRHEATSRLCESGKLKQMEIMEMTGHKTLTTFEGYVKLIAHENDRRLD